MSLTISKPRKLREPIRINNLGGVRKISANSDSFLIDEFFDSVLIDESSLKINYCGSYAGDK